MLREEPKLYGYVRSLGNVNYDIMAKYNKTGCNDFSFMENMKLDHCIFDDFQTVFAKKVTDKNRRTVSIGECKLDTNNNNFAVIGNCVSEETLRKVKIAT